MTHLFTLLCEFRGGTYTRQVSAPDPRTAFARWADVFCEDPILSASEQALFREAVAYSLSEGGLVPMEGLQNIWYEGFSIGDDLLEVTVVGMWEEGIGLP